MRRETSRSYGDGFTLIELMITVAIVAILAAIAYPSYTRHVMKAHRSTGQGKLLEVMQAEERYFTTHDTYTTELKTELGYDEEPVPADGGWYTVAADVCSESTDLDQCVVLTATPQNSQTTDTTCGNLTLSSRGEKGSKGSLEECW